jgi:hypothetical protein
MGWSNAKWDSLVNRPLISKKSSSNNFGHKTKQLGWQGSQTGWWDVPALTTDVYAVATNSANKTK